MKNKTKGRLLKATGLAIDIAFPLAAVFTQFPIWVNRSSAATFSGLFLLMAFISCIPFIKQIKQWLKSPAIWSVWLVMLVIFVILRAIITEMVIVCFVGAVSNCIGAAVYKAGEYVKTKPDVIKLTVEEDEETKGA